MYHMVTFRPDVGYAEAKRRERWQKEVVGRVVEVVSVGVVVGGIWWAGSKRMRELWGGIRR